MFTRFSLKDYNFKLLITVIIAMICGVVMINSADSSFTLKNVLVLFYLSSSWLLYLYLTMILSAGFIVHFLLSMQLYYFWYYYSV